MQVKRLKERDDDFDKAMKIIDKRFLTIAVNTINDISGTNKVLKAIPVARADEFFTQLRKLWGDWNKYRRRIMVIIGNLLKNKDKKINNYIKRKLLQWKENACNSTKEINRNKIAKWIENLYKISVSRKNWENLSDKYTFYINKSGLNQIKIRLINWLKLRDMSAKLRYRFTIVGIDQFKGGIEFKFILIIMRTLYENWDERNNFLTKRFFIRKWYMQVKKLRERDNDFDNENEIKSNKLEENLNEKGKIKIKALEKSIKELNNKNEILTKNEINYKNKIKEYENIIKIKNDKYNEKLKKEEELEEKLNQMLEKEKRENFVEKEMNRLKDEKEKLEIDKKESIRMKQENSKLIEKNKELKKDIDEKQKIYNHILKNIEEAKNNFQNIMNIKNKTIINDYEEIKLVGLNNVGSICIMNSVLQCLSQTKPLTDYFLNDKNIDRIINNNIAIKKNNEVQLSPIYYALIKQLWNKNGSKSIFPNNFMNQIEKMNPSFKQSQAGDSKDFIIFILKQLHKELKLPIQGINKNNIGKPLNQYDKNNSFNYFLNEFSKGCSIISDIFFGFNEITNECINCKNICNLNGINNSIFYNYEIFNCLILPLEKIKNNKNNKVSINECFIYLNKSETFIGENRYFCNICKSVSDSVYSSKILIAPNILILILHRGKDIINDVKLEFNETIDITQFVLKRDKPQLIFNLYGVITYIDKRHFIASCKSSLNNKWYRFNDDNISPISSIQKEVIEFGIPYILFYQRN